MSVTCRAARLTCIPAGTNIAGPWGLDETIVAEISRSRGPLRVSIVARIFSWVITPQEIALLFVHQVQCRARTVVAWVRMYIAIHGNFPCTTCIRSAIA